MGWFKDDIMGVHWKIPFLGRGGSQNPIYIEIAQKGENLGKVADLREGLWKKRGGGWCCWLRGWYPNGHC